MTPLQDVFWLSLGILVVWMGYVLRGIFIPMLIAFTAAYAINPLLQYAEKRWKFRRSLLIGGSLAGLAVSFVVSALLLGPQLIGETDQLITKAPEYFDTIADKLNGKVDSVWIDGLNAEKEKLPLDTASLTKVAFEHAGKAIGVVGSILGTVTYVIAALILIPIYFAYFAWNFNPLLERMKGWIPEANRESVLHIAQRMDSAVGNFIRGRLLVVAAMMVAFSIGFWVAGVPYWFLIGCATGALSFVPYLAVVGCGIAMLMTWVDASSGNGEATLMVVVVWPLGAYCIVQLLEGWLLTPWIQSQSMEMSAVTILIVLMVGGSLAGIYGLLLAIPVTGCLKILIDEFLAPKLDEWASDAAQAQ